MLPVQPTFWSHGCCPANAQACAQLVVHVGWWWSIERLLVLCCSEEVEALSKAVKEHGMALVVFAEW